MKTKIIVMISLTAVFGGSALVVISQQTPATDTAPTDAADSGTAAPTGRFVLDRTTWDVVDLQDSKGDLSTVNTAEARSERYKAVLALESPDEFKKQFPRTAEENLMDEAISKSITQPQTLDDYLNEPRSSAEQQEILDALEASQHPKPIIVAPTEDAAAQ